MEDIIILIFFIIIGAIFGSFISLVTYRIPIGQDIIVKSSNCPKCKHKLGIKDLFPIFSWIASKGKCRYCNEKISFRYPIIELSTSMVFLITYLIFGLNSEIFFLIPLIILFIIITVTDLEYYIISDKIQILILIISIVFSIYVRNISIKEISLLLFAGLSFALLLKYGFLFIAKKDGLGMGDVKLMPALFLLVGFKNITILLFIAGFFGIITSLIWNKLQKGKEFPFGPSLVTATYLCLLDPDLNNKIFSLFYL